MDIYNPFITAIHRNSPSVPMLYLLNHGYLDKGRIIDFGAGRGFDVDYLRGLNFNIVGYDKYNIHFNDLDLLDDYYDILTCNYVFNVIPDWSEFYDTKQQIVRLAKNVYVTVRADDKAIKPNWSYDEYYEGYWTGRSFQRFYTPEKVMDHFKPYVKGIVANTPGFIIAELEGQL